MGCGSSVYSDPKIASWRPQFEALGLDKACAGKLFKIFKKSDLSKDGFISDLEILMLLDMERTPFTERIFKIFDIDGSSQLDFREFIIALWNFCSIGEYLPHFAFSLYDLDASGEITDKEIKQMLIDVYGKDYDKNHIAMDLYNNQIPKYAGKTIDINEFLGFVHNHDKLLFPAFEVVRKLQDCILGGKFWDKQTKDRKAFSHGHYMKVEEFLHKKFPKEHFDDHPLDKKMKSITSKGIKSNNNKVHPNK